MAPTSIVLPAPVSPGQGGHPGVEQERDLVDHAEVADGQLSEHRQRTLSDAAFESGWAGGSRA